MMTDREIELFRDAFRNVAEKGRRSNAPEAVSIRNDMMADLLQELLDLRNKNAYTL